MNSVVLMAQPTAAVSPQETEFDRVIFALNDWLVGCDYAGYEPYDLLNSPYLANWASHQPFATLFIQTGKRAGGLALRRLLRIAPSRNPKALALILAAYCDLAGCGWDCELQADHVRLLLDLTRSPNEPEYCWGYDWHYVSLRGARLPAHSPNSIATVFCAEALFDHARAYGNVQSRAMALSAAVWLCSRLNRSVDNDSQLCFSYTPGDHTQIFNNSALIGALLARVGSQRQDGCYRNSARRVMQYLADGQATNGAWPYGKGRAQGWIDSFHTGYNLCALLSYQQHAQDFTFAEHLAKGYEYYARTFFRADGAPKYFHNRTYPIDIHACSQAILTFCAFAELDPHARARALNVARWTIANLRNGDGSFGYQIHRLWRDRTPYIRWSQAWMLRALARLRRQLT
jgi:hypothetical protein